MQDKMREGETVYTGAMPERTGTFNMRLSDEEAKQFDRVAAHYGLPVASMLRMLVREKDIQIQFELEERATAKIYPDGGMHRHNDDDGEMVETHRRHAGTMGTVKNQQHMDNVFAQCQVCGAIGRWMEPSKKSGPPRPRR